MKNKVKFIILLLWSSPCFAQNYAGGFHTSMGIPLGALKEKMGNTVFPEFNFLMYSHLINSPLDLGINIGYGVYGTKLEKRRDLYTGSTDELRLRRNNNLLSIMGLIRYNFNQITYVIPFMEAQIGTNYLFTRYKISETRFSETMEEGRDFSNWVMAYRIGGGLKFPFKNKDLGHWEIKAIYQESSLANFLRKGDTIYNADSGEFEYNIQRSPINFIQPGIGVILFFND